MSRIEAALSFAREQIDDVDLHILQHRDFGKGDIKKCKISPDAFIQMAIQLAYYKVRRYLTHCIFKPRWPSLLHTNYRYV